MIIGGIAEGTGFSAAEIDAFTARDALYWWNCVMAFRAEIQKKQD
ncbi:hypothetical protein [Rhizobium sp. RU35A]|nr:hypothetical protein [Rhizobium sp. RU35A]